MTDYIGFYWTLPVPWAGHHSLPQDVEEAARKSRTIRYQRARAGQWAKDNKGHLIEERVFMELAPDRGTEHIVPEVEKALKRCRDTGARLLVVDFSQSFGWRSHMHLGDVLRDSVDCILLDPSAIMLDGAMFDPVDHFTQWRKVQKAFSSSKKDRLAQAKSAVEALAPDHPHLTGLAEALNDAGHRTATGLVWTKDNLRKFLKSG